MVKLNFSGFAEFKNSTVIGDSFDKAETKSNSSFDRFELARLDECLVPIHELRMVIRLRFYAPPVSPCLSVVVSWGAVKQTSIFPSELGLLGCTVLIHLLFYS